MAQAASADASYPGALDADEVLRQIMHDDQEEWEYEYSTTDTETFYLTIELSYPEFKGRPTLALPHNRGGYYNGANLGTAASEPHDGGVLSDDDENGRDKDDNGEDEDVNMGNNATKEKTRAARAEEAGDDDDVNEDDDASVVDPELARSAIDTEKRQKKNKGKEPQRRGDDGQGEGAFGGDGENGGNNNDDDDEAEDIQILDLHSERPLISYRGRVFEGRWAEVIGTEAILAHHEKKQPLPALRNLADGIDMLAASSSRIMTTEKIVNAKEPQVDELAAIRGEWNIRIPAGKHKSQEKMQQLRFLENMIALKKKKGQTDQVTVYATDGAGKNWSDNRRVDYKPRLPKRRTTNSEDESEEEEEEEGCEGEGEGEGAESPEARRRRILTRQQRRRRRQRRREADEREIRDEEEEAAAAAAAAAASQGSRTKLTRDEAADGGRDDEGDTTMTGG
ncbi:hypothetical protein CP532_5750 [Ophiocordyceps camponoti-leonardi (nom. inval.)]|nr:hypothetical protein CP532_5750 [Ophiocordyceps camponoti-leonardi (nom. inval.)]